MSSADLFDLFASDKQSEEDGRWVELTPETSFKIRAFGSKAVIDLRDKEMRPYQALLRAGGKLPDEKNEEIGFRVIAGAVIADWKGVKNAEKVEVPYSADEAYAIVKALPKFAGFIVNYSMDAQNYRDELREDGAGNS